MEKEKTVSFFRVTDPMQAIYQNYETEKMVNRIRIVSGIIGGTLGTGFGLWMLKKFNIGIYKK